MKRIALIALLMAGLSGCNTVAGLGQDVSDGARTVQGML